MAGARFRLRHSADHGMALGSYLSIKHLKFLAALLQGEGQGQVHRGPLREAPDHRDDLRHRGPSYSPRC
jgi:hypothetical protein